MKSWYRTIREDELKDGSIRKVYHLVFETYDKNIVEKVEQFFCDVMDAKTEPTISKMEQVDKPQKDCKKCKNYDRCKNNRWKCCVYEPKDEPQTERSE